MRIESAAQLVELDFEGYAIGGLAVGEPRKHMYEVLEWTVPHLPVEKPHYLMGVGYPQEMVQAVRSGIDMFDCVIPTRHARHGNMFVWNRKSPTGILKDDFYETINITNAQFENDKKPLSKHCSSYACTKYSRGYIRHLFKTKEMLGARLATIHNIHFYTDLMKVIRQGVLSGKI